MQDIETQLNKKNYIYQIMDGILIKQQQWCFSIAINNENSIMLIGCGNVIKLFYLKQEKAKFFQYFLTPKRVIILKFFNFKFQFISTSEDNSILIWSPQLNAKSKFLMKYKGHFSNIQCLVLHPIEDQLLITGSYDSTIKFWICKNKCEILYGTCTQTITDHSSHVYGLSINQKGDKLLSCGLDYTILVIENKNDQLYSGWVVKQKIKVKIYGYRISFIQDQIFAYLPRSQSHLIIYTQSSVDKEYIQTEEVEIQGGKQCCNRFFPIQYCSKKQLLLVKNGYNLNFIRVSILNQQIENDNSIQKKQEKLQFQNEKRIFCSHYQIYGTLSNDGDYLAFWTESRKEVQIFKYKESLD